MWRNLHERERRGKERPLFVLNDDVKKAATTDRLSEANLQVTAGQLASLVMEWHAGGKSRAAVRRVLLLGRWFRNERIIRRMSIQQLSNRTCIDPDLLRQIESGMASSEVVDNTQETIAQALGLQIPEFMQGAYMREPEE